MRICDIDNKIGNFNYSDDDDYKNYKDENGEGIDDNNDNCDRCCCYSPDGSTIAVGYGGGGGGASKQVMNILRFRMRTHTHTLAQGYISYICHDTLCPFIAIFVYSPN